MQQNHAKAIKGLSIAVIILSALAIFICLVGAIGMSILAPIISSYTTDTYMPYTSDFYGNNYYYDYGYDYYSDALFAQIVSVFAGGLFIFALLCSVVTLIAGIIGLRNAENPSKLGLVFGWSIAGAIVGFLGCGIIMTVLLIIVAVFSHKDKQLFQAGYYNTPVAYGVTYETASSYPQAQPSQTDQGYAPYANAYQQNPAQPAATSEPIQPVSADSSTVSLNITPTETANTANTAQPSDQEITLVLDTPIETAVDTPDISGSADAAPLTVDETFVDAEDTPADAPLDATVNTQAETEASADKPEEH